MKVKELDSFAVLLESKAFETDSVVGPLRGLLMAMVVVDYLLVCNFVP